MDVETSLGEAIVQHPILKSARAHKMTITFSSSPSFPLCSSHSSIWVALDVDGNVRTLSPLNFYDFYIQHREAKKCDFAYIFILDDEYDSI